MSCIFISYRRETTAAFAGRLSDRLSTHFGKERTFLDFDTIDPGDDFVNAIEKKLADAAVLLVLIGCDWLTCKDNQGHIRLADPADFVRLEVATALRHGVRVIPLLIDYAPMPAAEQLPEDLAPLARRQAIGISNAGFRQEVTNLIAVLEKFLTTSDEEQGEKSRRAKSDAPPRNLLHQRQVWVVAAFIFAVALAVLVWPRDTQKRASTAEKAEKEAKPADEPKQGLQEPRPSAPAALDSRTAGPHSRTRTNTNDGLTYQWIPAGSFSMGCSKGDQACDKQESPPRRVSISTGFWLGKTEVTVGAYKKYVRASTDRTMPPTTDYFHHSVQEPWTNEGLPMTNVTWEEASDFCKWAGGRLPTEAQWEYAARGGNESLRYGSLSDIAWHSDNSAVREIGVYIRAIHEPAQKLPNSFGLSDMLGNAMEWVGDWYDPGYYSYGPTTDPPGPASTGLRVFRGACSDNKPADVRVSYRHGLDPQRRIYIFGFRCVWDTPNLTSQ